jgi:hypothetical protein
MVCTIGKKEIRCRIDADGSENWTTEDTTKADKERGWLGGRNPKWGEEGKLLDFGSGRDGGGDLDNQQICYFKSPAAYGSPCRPEKLTTTQPQNVRGMYVTMYQHTVEMRVGQRCIALAQGSCYFFLHLLTSTLPSTYVHTHTHTHPYICSRQASTYTISRPTVASTNGIPTYLTYTVVIRGICLAGPVGNVCCPRPEAVQTRLVSW